MEVRGVTPRPVVVTMVSLWWCCSDHFYWILRIALVEWYELCECIEVDIHHSPLVEKILSSNLQLSNVVLNVGVGFVRWIMQTPKLAIQRVHPSLVRLRTEFA